MVALSMCCLFLCSCENKIDQVKNLGKKKAGVEEGYNIESLMSQNAKMKAKLVAPYMLRFQADSPRIEFTKTLKVDFFDSTLAIETKLFSKYAKYTEGDGKIFLRDSVVVFNVKGDTLLTNELWWDQQRAIFYTDKAIQFRSKDGIIYGTGFWADQTLKNKTINNPTGFRNVPDGTL